MGTTFDANIAKVAQRGLKKLEGVYAFGNDVAKRGKGSLLDSSIEGSFLKITPLLDSRI